MTVGIAPPNGSGPALQDGQWLLGVAAGNNRSYKNGIVAGAAATKATATQMPAGVQILEVDTVGVANGSVLMPAAVAGQIVMVFNNGANTLDIYGRGTDTINGSATANAHTLATLTAAVFFCGKTGAWAGVGIT